MVSPYRGRVQEHCWDPHESASLGEELPRVGQGLCGALGRELWWSVGALAPHKLVGAGSLQGRCLFWAVHAALDVGSRRPGFEPG